MSNQLATTDAPKTLTPMARVRNYMTSVEVKRVFSEMMGKDAIFYLNQVLVLVANSEKLQACTPQSILISAMRAASMKLSLDPGQGQAWIIPYAGKAQYQTGFRGVYELAMRTNAYRFINVFAWYEGETLDEDRMTGFQSLHGKRTGDKILGYCLYFELTSGYKKTYSMTVPEIEKHAEHYAPSYHHKDSPWNDEWERPKMMMKTVLSNGLRKWGKFNPLDKAMLDEVEEGQGTIVYDLPDEASVTQPEPEPKAIKDEGKILNELGFDADTPKQPPLVPPDQTQTDAEPKKTKADVKAEYRKLAVDLRVAASDAERIWKDAKGNSEQATKTLREMAPAISGN